MSMFASRLLTAPVVAAWLIAASIGCGSGPGADKAAMPEIKALHFSGVDLEYALERIAAEAGIPLALDEVRPDDSSPDLGLYRVDIDLPAGPLDEALHTLAQATGGIDFEIVEGVLYVRSNLLVSDKTPIDLPLLGKTSFKGTLDQLLKHVRTVVPKFYVTVDHDAGTPAAPEVEFEIADKASVKQVLLQYAAASKLGWRMFRAGQVLDDPKLGVVVVGTTISLRAPRTSTSRLPEAYSPLCTTSALASASARLGVPILVLDRSVMMTTRGSLNLSLQADGKMPLRETIDELGESGFGPEQWHFRWKTIDDVPVIESRAFLHQLAGRDLLREELLAGEFEGSLPELTRWINTHRKRPTHEVLMGGEAVEGQRRGKITIAPGTTVQRALVMFAKSSAVSPYVLLVGDTNPLTGALLSDRNSWQGAFVQDLSEWLPTLADYRRAGVTPPPS